MGFRDALKQLQRRLVVAASPWKYRKGRVPLPFRWLVSPLRYDVLVRLEYFRFHERNLELYRGEFPRYLELARQQPYFVWFREVLCRRRFPQLREDPAGLARAFEQRVRAAAELHRGFRERGFDERNPIILRAGRRIRPTPTGKRIRRKLFVGDGCHRMALLMLAGAEILNPGQYRVRHEREHEPLDNTHLLIGPLGLTRTEYYRFLSGGYCGSTYDDRELLLDAVRRVEPHYVAEVTEVSAIDERQLT